MTPNVTLAEFTRPADTTAYAAGDAITNSTGSGVAMSFTGAVKYNGASGFINRVLLKTSNNATPPTLSLLLFKSTPGAQNDNAAVVLTYANRETHIATIPLSAAVAVGSCAIADYTCPTPIPITSTDGSTLLFGVLMATGAYTPASAQQFSVKLFIVPELI